MCIRDRDNTDKYREFYAKFGRFLKEGVVVDYEHREGLAKFCLLYTSDAADERSSVDLGGRRIIKKKKSEKLVERGATVKKITRKYLTKHKQEKQGTKKI